MEDEAILGRMMIAGSMLCMLLSGCDDRGRSAEERQRDTMSDLKAEIQRDYDRKMQGVEQYQLHIEVRPDNQ